MRSVRAWRSYARTVIRTYTISRAQCLIDFSPDMSVSIGCFNTASIPGPKFEVGEKCPSYFHGPIHADGGIVGVTDFDHSSPVSETGGTWINGTDSHPIRRCIFNNGAQSAGTAKYYTATDFKYADIGIPIALYGSAKIMDNSGERFIPLPYLTAKTENNVRASITTSGAQVAPGANISVESGTLIFEYTTSS